MTTNKELAHGEIQSIIRKLNNLRRNIPTIGVANACNDLLLQMTILDDLLDEEQDQESYSRGICFFVPTGVGERLDNFMKTIEDKFHAEFPDVRHDFNEPTIFNDGGWPE